MLRNVAGLTGIGLLCAAAAGGAMAWAGPVSYLVPFIAGKAVITTRGARDQRGD